MPIDDRYQNQPWYVRWWRCRHYLGVPWTAWKLHRSYWVDEKTGERDDEDLDWRTCWSIAIGLAQGPMNYYYTWEEVKATLDIPDYDKSEDDLDDEDDAEEDI